MAAQAQLIVETIVGMRRAINRGDDASDSDESIHQPTNRGNKLKRKAHFVHEGRLDLPNGPRVYKRKIDHAGYKRYILYKNPVRFDEDGYELEDDEIDEFADAMAAEENPYADIRLEELLCPLTNAADLPSHPSLSVPYNSNALPETVNQVGKMVREEKASLWRMKQLLTKFRGDEDWAPCGIMVTNKDSEYFGPLPVAAQNAALGKHTNGQEKSIMTDKTEVEGETNLIESSARINGNSGESQTEDTPRSVPAESDFTGQQEDEKADADTNEDVAMVEVANGQTPASDLTLKSKEGEIEGLGIKTEDGASIIEASHVRSASEATTERANDEADMRPSDADKTSEAEAVDATTETAKAPEEESEQPAEPAPGATDATTQPPEGSVDDEEDASESQPAPHRMTTRAQAQAASDNTTTERTRSHSPASSSARWVHPMFLAPESAHPNRDFGLQPVEAEDIRRLLLSYVQKQEEICRNAEKLYDGLLRADRLRKTVLKWTKAEGHVGEMSDGEDWYDKEEWGLEDDLKKGHEEDEDDGNQGKKTRVRRG